jgi:hypothetical protein
MESSNKLLGEKDTLLNAAACMPAVPCGRMRTRKTTNERCLGVVKSKVFCYELNHVHASTNGKHSCVLLLRRVWWIKLPAVRERHLLDRWHHRAVPGLWTWPNISSRSTVRRILPVRPGHCCPPVCTPGPSYMSCLSCRRKMAEASSH